MSRTYKQVKGYQQTHSLKSARIGPPRAYQIVLTCCRARLFPLKACVSQNIEEDTPTCFLLVPRLAGIIGRARAHGGHECKRRKKGRTVESSRSGAFVVPVSNMAKQ